MCWPLLRVVVRIMHRMCKKGPKKNKLNSKKKYRPSPVKLSPQKKTEILYPPHFFFQGGQFHGGGSVNQNRKGSFFSAFFFAHQISTFDVDFSWWRIVRMCYFLFISFFFLFSFSVS